MSTNTSYDHMSCTDSSRNNPSLWVAVLPYLATLEASCCAGNPISVLLVLLIRTKIISSALLEKENKSILFISCTIKSTLTNNDPRRTSLLVLYSALYDKADRVHKTYRYCVLCSTIPQNCWYPCLLWNGQKKPKKRQLLEPMPGTMTCD